MTSDPRSRYVAYDVPDLFNTVPAILGFHPSESLVVISTHGPRHRFGCTMRVDLPAAEHVDLVARHVALHLRQQGADGAIVLALTRRQEIARDLTQAVEHLLGDVEPVVVARADGTRYWVDVPGFPPDGVAYESSDHHVAIVQAVAAGQEVLPDRQALVDRWAPATGERRRLMTEACETVQRHVVRTLLRHDAADRGVAELAPVLEAIEDGRPLSDAEVALLCVWVGSTEVRDHVWHRVVADTARAYLDAMSHAARSVVPPHEPAVLCLAAFAAWSAGDGAQAVIAAERARTADPSYAMAALLLDLVGRGVPPTSWQPDRDAA